MKLVLRLIVIAMIAGLGWWLWTVFFPSPAKVVRQRLVTLANTATFGAHDSVVARAAKAQKFSSMFSRDVTIRFNSAGYGARELTGMDELTESANGAFAAIRELKVEFLDITVTVAADRLSAEANCTARVRMADKSDYGVSEMRFKFKKIEGKWLISLAETVKTLS